MTKDFEDFMYRNSHMIVFLRWDTIAYLHYLEMNYDEEKYSCAYRLLEDIDNLFDFYQAAFDMETEKEVPEDLFYKSKITKGFLSHIGMACEKYSDFYGQRYESSRNVLLEDGSYSNGNSILGGIYNCLHRISDDCSTILKFDEYDLVEEKA